MGPASVSLAKLDQVKAKVYNLGLADPRSFRGGGAMNHVSTTRGQQAVGAALNLDTQPPLSNISSQKHAW